MTSKFLFPESTYRVDEKMTRKKLLEAYEKKLSITGFVKSFDNDSSGCFTVNIGGEFIGIMPKADSTIYPIYKEDGTFTGEFSNLVGRTIRAKVLYVNDENSDPYVFLSREKNMKEALESIKRSSEISKATIVGFSEKTAFVDIGQGILGRILAKDFSYCYYQNIKDVGLEKGDSFPVKILNFDRETSKFDLSRLACLPTAKEVLTPGDLCIAKVFSAVYNNPNTNYAYYVCMKNYLCGILDSKIPLRYGEEVLVKVKKISPKGAHLKFEGLI